MSISAVLLAIFFHVIIGQEENHTMIKSNSSTSINSSSSSWEEIIFDREYYDGQFEIVDITQQELDIICSEKIKLAAMLAASDSFSDDENSDDEDDEL